VNGVFAKDGKIPELEGYWTGEDGLRNKIIETTDV
jgi:hypothetical protein